MAKKGKPRQDHNMDTTIIFRFLEGVGGPDLWGSSLYLTGSKLFFVDARGSHHLLAEWVERVILLRKWGADSKRTSRNLNMLDFATSLMYLAMESKAHDKLLSVSRPLDDAARAEALLISHTRGL